MAIQEAAPGSRPLVRRGELIERARLIGSNYRMLAPHTADDVVLEGRYSLVRLRPGLILHASDARDTHDLTTQIVVRPALTCSIVLAGHVDFSVGDRDFCFGPGLTGKRAPAAGYLVSKAQADTFTRRGHRGVHVRKVNVTVEPGWLDDNTAAGSGDPAGLRRFSGTHLASLTWHPSARIVSLAEQILLPPAYGPGLQRLYLESRAIEIVLEAMLAAAEGTPPRTSLSPRDHSRLKQVCDFLHAPGNEALSLEAIARHAGMSVSALHRLFRATHGMSVFDYVRLDRLHRARHALERDGVTVTQAAYIAGYRGPANFATAFKRLYGLSPRHARGRV